MQQRKLTLSEAREVLAAAEAAAARLEAPSSIAVVDDAGDLLAFAQMDSARPAGIDLAIGKARTAARFRQPTQALEQTINTGRAAAITAGAIEMQGGVPLAAGGAIMGAVGVSGMNKDNDTKAAEAGVAALG